jgi:hypothetical protein
MGVLIPLLAGASLLAGCYAPSLRDCTVSCESASECASGQVCGADGLCAAPGVAGRCARMPDAGVPPDVPAVDAAPPDIATTIVLRVQVMGKGSIIVDGHGTCSSRDPQRGNCMYDIAFDAPQRVRAVPIELDDLFTEWTSKTCEGEGPICTFTPVGDTSVTAKFGRAPDDDDDDVHAGAP